jgi:hypothetical protein
VDVANALCHGLALERFPEGTRKRPYLLTSAYKASAR